ncbi:hypothetical protein [Streptococcus sobrinus]|uniref:hypothetical protein n=1 Tax=Streptococcus sobrinus TaxID=1310 RepID=UPI0002DE6DB7|nr:hypothetical protein [Streptococcus sobrinus]
MKEILTTKIQLAAFEVQKASLTLGAAGNPFKPSQDKIDQIRGWIAPVGIAGLILGGIVALIIYGLGGEEAQAKSKKKLGRITLACMGVGCLPAIFMWFYTWGQQGF